MPEHGEVSLSHLLDAIVGLQQGLGEMRGELGEVRGEVASTKAYSKITSEQTTLLNGRMLRLEEWRQGHDQGHRDAEMVERGRLALRAEDRARAKLVWTVVDHPLAKYAVAGVALALTLLLGGATWPI